MKNEIKEIEGLFQIESPCLNLIKGNRPTYDVSKLTRAMMHGEYIPPIIVDKDTLTIIDGQNRYAAATLLWKQEIPVRLQVLLHKFQNPLLAAIQFNNSSKRWTSANYVEAWICDGRESYAMLKQFVHDCPKLSYKTATELLYGKNSPSIIPNGTFKTNEHSIIQGTKVYKELDAMSEAVGCETFFNTGIPASWVKVRNNILNQMEFDKWLKAFKKHFQVPGSKKQEYWISEFYRIQSKVRQKL